MAAAVEKRKSQGCVPDDILPTFEGLSQLKHAAAATFQVANVTDANIVQRMLETIVMYEESASMLRRSAAQPPVRGISGHEEYSRLADDYEARAQRIREVVQMLKEAGFQ
eukprot:CAMPEP_0203966848 /NCGR_PEP_ID=MMETSP0359-20131031/95966_1 /ASSEMBLY_ACC=CAM_ASM_000338 /TAXON_ID=268821 /ORGANISM="Scrippsiella Hangoei, Strain SHTV-5" /LENGTH=109 /DNA_ID=CAMNT_0050904403 /DNA_START=60 /DNA_END=389 /DNA_ORIENTATION=+